MNSFLKAIKNDDEDDSLDLGLLLILLFLLLLIGGFLYFKLFSNKEPREYETSGVVYDISSDLESNYRSMYKAYNECQVEDFNNLYHVRGRLIHGHQSLSGESFYNDLLSEKVEDMYLEIDNKCSNVAESSVPKLVISFDIVDHTNTNDDPNGDTNDDPNGDANDDPNGDAYDDPNGDAYDDPNGDAYDDPNGDAYDDPNGDTYDDPNGDTNDDDAKNDFINKPISPGDPNVTIGGITDEEEMIFYQDKVKLTVKWERVK